MRWDAASGDLSGYRVYAGPSSGNYARTIDVGLTTSRTIDDLDDCQTWHLAVKAIGSDGQLSPEFSNEISGWARPRVLSASASLERGTQQTLELNGANFQSGLEVRAAGSGVTIVSAAALGCNRLEVTVDVAENAPLGSTGFIVVNPDGVFGENGSVTSITADSTAPQIADLGVDALGATTATISWTTSEASTSSIEFRAVGDPAWQIRDVRTVPATTHEASITGLAPGTDYQFVVSVTDEGDNSDQSLQQSFVTQANSQNYVALEAEWSDGSGALAEATSSTAFGGSLLRLPNNASAGSPTNPNGQRELRVTIQGSATWTAWLRVQATSTNSDSWLFAVDGGPWSRIDPSTSGEWVWVRGPAQSLGPGEHRFALGGLEPGAAVDQLLLTDDATFVPSLGPNGDLVAPPELSAFTATPDDSQVTLNYTAPTANGGMRLIIRQATDRFPAHPFEGLGVLNQLVNSGQSAARIVTALENGTTYRFAAFVIDSAGNVSAASTVLGTPESGAAAPDPVVNVERSDTLEE